MKNFFSNLFFCCVAIFFSTTNSSLAQYNPLKSPNTFQSPDNPYYWKSRKPHADYWQQDAHYKIKANIDEKTDIITATEELTYWNNSPDTLDFVFFHLYQNAFQPGSHYDNLHQNNGIESDFGDYEKDKLGTTVDEIKIAGQSLKTELDNTILKVYLPKPLLPNQSISFDIKFKTYFDIGSMRRRMKPFKAYGFQHYNGVHWYPRISVYDRKFGWTTDQHLGREFYGDFGCFDVELTFANNYVVEATGFLQNREQVLPDSLRAKLDIKNFKDKPWGEKPSIITPYDSTKRKTWIFHSENTHDFAFTADPTYRIGECKILPFDQSDDLDSIVAVALVQEPHASKWQNAAPFTAEVIKVYSQDIGMYAYNKIIVADAKDGMEYPMITLDNGKDPTYRGLLAHEVGHNWFFGMIGNNETYRASLDEGFTQFLTAWSLIKVDGKNFVRDPYKSNYKNKHKIEQEVLDSRVYFRYLEDAIRMQDPSLSTHSDDFGGAIRHGGGYRHVYYKTATMLYNLRYVLGEELFLEAMQHYFDKWKICHPYLEDFRKSIIEYTKADLNWFFDQWLIDKEENIDYAVKKVKPSKKDKNTYTITFERKGTMQMPIDFSVVTKANDTINYHIPNTWFTKPTNATVLPKWIGWGNNLNPTYEAEVKVEGKIENVIIDPDYELADVYMPDNRLNREPDFRFDYMLNSKPNRKRYEIEWRPDVWYNAYDGVKAGFHVNGDYMEYKHKFDLSVWYNTRILQDDMSNFLHDDPTGNDPASFILSYENGIPKISKNASIFLRARILDGIHGFQAGYRKDLNEKSSIYTYYKVLYKTDSASLNYLLHDRHWIPAMFNNSLNVGLDHRYHYDKGDGFINLNLRSSSLFSDYNYAYLSFEAKNNTDISKLLLKTRVVGRLGTGNTPLESALYLAGANSEDLSENKYTRSRGIIPGSWGGYDISTNNFHGGGGLNLRGYSGYTTVDSNTSDGNIYEVYYGNSGIAINAELELDDLIKFKPKALSKIFKLDVYLFGDAGTIFYRKQNNDIAIAGIRADAGLGTALTIKKFGPLETPKPLTIRFDMPLILNRTPFADPNFAQFRWVLGINRAF